MDRRPCGAVGPPLPGVPLAVGADWEGQIEQVSFPRRCLSSVALARQHRLRSCSSPRIGARFNVVLQLLDRVILWRCGVKPIRSGLAFVFRTKLGIVRRRGAIRCILAYDLFEMSCTRLSAKKKNKNSRVVQPNCCLMSHVNYFICAEPDPTCGAGHSTAVIPCRGQFDAA